MYLAVAVLMVAVAFQFSSRAEAFFIHTPVFDLSEIPAEGLLGEPIAYPGPLQKMESVAFDSGHLWVVEGANDEGESVPSRIDDFDAATGDFIAQPVHVAAPTEAEYLLPTGYGYGYGEGVAVGHGLGEALLYVGGEIHGVSVVSVFDEAGALKGSWNGAGVPGGSFGFVDEGGGRRAGTVTDVAVDNSTSKSDPAQGNVYVDVESHHVIDIFHPEKDGEEHYVGQIAGISPSEPFQRIQHVAVDEANGDVLVLEEQNKGASTPEEGRVDVFEPMGSSTYGLLNRFGPPPGGVFGPDVGGLAVDSATGEVYVTEGGRLDQFSLTGAYLGYIENTSAVYSLAVDTASQDIFVSREVYGPNIVLPDVTTNPPEDVKPEGVVLNGTVNPDGEEGNVTCRFEWGTSPSFGHTVACSKEIVAGGSPVSVQSSLNGLERGVTYYYRLTATNKNGTNPGEALQTESFTTPGAILRDESISDVGDDSLTFEATVDPHNQPTSYYFQYGTSTEYGQQTPSAPEAIGSGAADVEVLGKYVLGLSPGVEYHYRVVLLSEAEHGEIETIYGADRTFTTQAAMVSSGLPDERAWELVTPAEKQGALFFGQNWSYVNGASESFVAQASVNGDATIDLASAPTEAEPQGNGSEVPVLSTRGPAGWTSRVIAPPHDRSSGVALDFGGEDEFFSEDLSRAVFDPWGPFQQLSPQASESTPYVRTDFFSGDVAAPCESSCYEPLVTAANTQSGVAFGEATSGGQCRVFICGPKFIDATPDANYVVVGSFVKLTATQYERSSGSESYEYEWSAGQLQPLYLLPATEEDLLWRLVP